MILRDVIVAEHARTLGRVVIPEPLRQEHSSVATLLESLTPVAPEMAEVLSDESPQFSVPAPLTFEQVAAWLAVTDGETREACASLLAEELTTVHERARQSGYKAGEERAKAEAAQEKERLLAVLSQVISTAESALEQERAALAEGCAEIVAEVLVKIAGATLIGHEAIVGTVMTVLGRMKDRREATIRVHAQDLPALRQAEDKLAELFGRCSFALVADPRVAVGGCIVETAAGSLDGRLDVQLQELFETLRSARATGSQLA